MNNNKKIIKAGLLIGTASLMLAGCSSLFNSMAKKNLDSPVGTIVLEGIENSVSIRRDDYGVPFVEAQSITDLTFGVGYAMSEDRLAQMVSMNLLARGRLSEMAGEVAVDMDIYMRTLGVPHIIEERYKTLSPELKGYLQSYADGVNAYIETHKKRLPLELRLSGYTPEPWQAENTIGLFVLLNLGVGFNLHEELAFLQLAEKLGAEKAAYLVPIYPDESIDFEEAKKLDNIPLMAEQLQSQMDFLVGVNDKLKNITGQGIAASNNWAVHKSKTANNASLVANDTHLLLSQPSTWMLMGVRSPEYSGIGVGLPGIPSIVAGYNGHIGWGETMVMADTQDLFLEKLRDGADGRTEYLYKDKWHPVTERFEIIKVKGSDPITINIQSTQHGPLLNKAITGPSKHAIIAQKTESRYGLALSWSVQFPDTTMDSFFRLGQAKNLQDVEEQLNGVGFIHLNVVAGDKDNVSWQVTGNYPLRKAGTGHFPSLGWTGEYDWQGYWGGAKTPRKTNPQSGYLVTANDRTVEPGFKPTLTSSWYYPERGERALQMLQASKQHTAQSMVDMQADRKDILVHKVQKLWQQAEWHELIQRGISELDQGEQILALSTLERILQFDGQMHEDSTNAAVWGAFEHLLARAILLDELGPEDSNLWQSLLAITGRAYSGYQDHLLGRKTPAGEYAPFWDNVNTPETETPGDIIAQTLVQVLPYLEQTLGKDKADWKWGNLAQYYWKTDTTHLQKYMKGVEGMAVKSLGKYTDRGPYPAGGNRNTLNVAGYDLGSDYNVWNIPAMRMVIDFSQDEPMQLVIAGGQSANPASPHYDDGIDLWLSNKNRVLPFNDPKKVEAHFNQLKVLQPK